ncbi:hypothetical protein AKJ09_08064 [Labilithrix luteola]|uniref:Uncharacterized protein n=1 Tax=Labilithrix luteola TaxID=1391654 RepID=A0A0K1Q6D8_9BACT|nr:hypothetical protein AKJ09_08064 [Labilithrix luteola]
MIASRAAPTQRHARPHVSPLGSLHGRSTDGFGPVLPHANLGELFGEHGFEYHGHSLYEPDVRTLLLARVAGAPPSTVDAPVSLADLTPTILELAGEASSNNRSATSEADPDECDDLSRRLPRERAALAETLESWESWVRRRCAAPTTWC